MKDPSRPPTRPVPRASRSWAWACVLLLSCAADHPGDDGHSAHPGPFTGQHDGGGGADQDTGAGGTEQTGVNPEPWNARNVDAAVADAVTPDAGDAGEMGEMGRARVDFEVLTKPTPESPFQPRNVVAIWVEDGAGVPVALLGHWAFARANALTVFRAHIEPLSPLTRDDLLTVDAVSGATLARHDVRSVQWDLVDYTGRAVPAGRYVVWVEMADTLQRSVVMSAAFEHGGEAFDLAIPESIDLGPARLEYHPAD